MKERLLIPYHPIHEQLRWSSGLVVGTVNFDDVFTKLTLVAVAAGTLFLLYHVGKSFPKESDNPRGLNYFLMLAVCGIGSAALKAGIGLSETWSWVVFLATSAASFCGLTSGYSDVYRREVAKRPNFRGPRLVPDLLIFVIASVASLVIVRGFFFVMEHLSR